MTKTNQIGLVLWVLLIGGHALFPGYTYASDTIVLNDGRRFNQAELEHLTLGDEFFYLDENKNAQNDSHLLGQVLMFLRDVLEKVFGNRVAQSIVSNIDLILIFILFVLVIIIIFKINNLSFSKLFYRKRDEAAIHLLSGNENLEALDLARLIEQAFLVKDYRLAIRYHYLEVLKMLASSQLIQWHPDKTNRQFINELSGKAVAGPFEKLALVFDYVWYGDFKVTPAAFEMLRNDFINFKKQLQQ